MAIYHFSGTIVGRSQGRSVVASAAYRAGERLYDERYQKFQDYSKREDVVYKNILAPNNVPDWTKNREKLWNKVEKLETRKDSQLAREFNCSLPRELSLAENIKLAEEFAQKAFVERGMVVDLAVHADHKSDGAYYHAHIMLTTRTIDSAGFGHKARTWNSKDLLIEWRQAWAEDCNRFLALNGLDLRVDHRTLAEQAIPLEPQYKIGPAASRVDLERLADHQRIARENGERLLQDPQIALKSITQQQSTFTTADLARFINRHTVDAQQFAAVFELVKSQTNIVKLGLDDKQQERFSTQEMLFLESKMLEQANILVAKQQHAIIRDDSIKHIGLTSEQQVAFVHITKAGDLKCLIGYAGTGKSYLLGAARRAWEHQGFRVQGITLSGKAAESLEAGSGIASRTLASRSYYWDRSEQLLTSQDVVVVDEAGMLGSRQLARIIDETMQAGAKVVLVGDPQQLQAIEAGAAFRAISDRVGYVELTEIRRQQEKWQQQATKEFATGKVRQALNRYTRAHHVHELATKELAKSSMINLWNDVRLQHKSCSQIMLAYTRDDVLDLNHKARELRTNHGELGAEQSFNTFRGARHFAINDRIYFLKNDRNLGVMNGSLGTITNVNPKALTVELDSPKRTVVVDFDLYNHIDHGYAATIHKAQGITVDRGYLLASKYLDAHATYVGMTRHRDSVDLFYSKEEFPKFNDLVTNLSRERAKDVSIDYTEVQKFAVTRDLVFQEELTKQPSLPTIGKGSFPFRNKFSNLEEFTTLDRFGKREQDFNQLRAELAQQFSDQSPKKLEVEFFKNLSGNLDQNNFDFDRELSNIRMQHQKIEQQTTKHEVVMPQYNTVQPQEVIRGIVGKSIKLPDGRKMIEISLGQNLEAKLVPEHRSIKNELGKEVELRFDDKCNMIGLKNSQTLEKETLMKQQAEQQIKQQAVLTKENVKAQREVTRELSRDRGWER